MPRRIRQAANYVMDHPDEIAFDPLSALATRAGTHPSAFVRLAQDLGFGGFSELQALARMRLTSPERSGTRSGTPDALTRMTEDVSRHVRRLDEHVDRDAFRRTADLLAGAHTVFLLGHNHGQLAILHFSQVLTASGIRNMAVCGSPGMPDGTLAFAASGDAAVVIDVVPPDPQVASQVQRLRMNGVPFVLLTDSPMHPLAHLEVPRFEVVRSIGSGLHAWASMECLGMALAAEIQARRSGQAPRDRRAPVERQVGKGQGDLGP